MATFRSNIPQMISILCVQSEVLYSLLNICISNQQITSACSWSPKAVTFYLCVAWQRASKMDHNCRFLRRKKQRSKGMALFKIWMFCVHLNHWNIKKEGHLMTFFAFIKYNVILKLDRTRRSASNAWLDIPASGVWVWQQTAGLPTEHWTLLWQHFFW